MDASSDTEQGSIFFMTKSAKIFLKWGKKRGNSIAKNKIFRVIFLHTKSVNWGGNCNYYKQLYNHFYLKLKIIKD